MFYIYILALEMASRTVSAQFRSLCKWILLQPKCIAPTAAKRYAPPVPSTLGGRTAMLTYSQFGFQRAASY